MTNYSSLFCRIFLTVSALLFAVLPTAVPAVAQGVTILSIAMLQTDPPPIIYRVPDQRDPRPGGEPPSSRSFIRNQAQASRFLAKATFGASADDIQALVGRDAADWLADEFAKPRTTFLDDVLALREPNGQFRFDIPQRQLWAALMGADDQLRMRMMFALSQILVASQEVADDADMTAFYLDALGANSFGTYRQLLGDVTYSPLMARWLTYFANRKGDPATGRVPDENYAREILQLFSIGLIELNRDGRPKVGPDGGQIATYDNDDVVGLARVFTGLAFNNGNFTDYPRRNEEPLIMYEQEHSPLEKTFLGTTIPANTSGTESIRRALNTIADHPNVGPFIARQLIQRFTASNPPPAYIIRVTSAFETGRFTADNGRRFGTGARGDFQATLAAILLDPFALEQPELQRDFAGKVREPILNFVHIVRAFKMAPIILEDEYRLYNTRPFSQLGQQMLRSPSVFNFYRPGYIAPNSESATRRLTAPEFQLLNASTSSGYINFISDFILNFTSQENLNPDYSAELALTSDPDALIRHLDTLLTGNRLSDTARLDILSIVSALPLRSGSNEARDRRRRVEIAIILIASSPAFFVIQ